MIADGADATGWNKQHNRRAAKVAGDFHVGDASKAEVKCGGGVGAAVPLPRPTSMTTAERYDGAAAELVNKKLVVEAKVDGAGRKIFARGALVKKTKLNLPIEESKLAFTTHGRFVKHLITEPCHNAPTAPLERLKPRSY